jgi:hypothetical protein
LFFLQIPISVSFRAEPNQKTDSKVFAMPFQVTNGTTLQCSMGIAPSSLVVLPANRTLASSQPAANIQDHVAMVNVMSFGMCTSPANPAVALATAAALGVLTPMPCIPATIAPWTPGVPTVLVGGMPAVDSDCKLMCMWAGVIQVVSPGQVTVELP